MRTFFKINLLFLFFVAVPALAQNPISPMGVYIADPSSRVVDGGL